MKQELILTANKFINELSVFKTKKDLLNVQRFYRNGSVKSKFIGVRMSVIFTLAKKFKQIPMAEIEKLLENEFYEARMGAVSIMDFQARDKDTTEKRKKELFDLYISKHRYIDNWDMVDRSAPYVIGGYLFNRSRNILYKLARSKNVLECRTAIVATYYFIRQNDVNDTFKIAEILIKDEHDLIQKAVGSWLREAGKKDQHKLIAFLDKYASTMPRVTLRYSIEKLNNEQKYYFMNLNK